MIPINESHIQQTLKSWQAHYNFGRPQSSLGQEFQIRDHRRPIFNRNDIGFRRIAES